MLGSVIIDEEAVIFEDAPLNVGVPDSGGTKDSGGRDSPIKERLCDRFGKLGLVEGEAEGEVAMLAILVVVGSAAIVCCTEASDCVCVCVCVGRRLMK